MKIFERITIMTIAAQLITFFESLDVDRLIAGNIEWRIPGKASFVLEPDNTTWDDLYVDLAWNESYAEINDNWEDMNDLIFSSAHELGVVKFEEYSLAEDRRITKEDWDLVRERVIQKIRNL